jgi:hypothetical protein
MRGGLVELREALPPGVTLLLALCSNPRVTSTRGSRIPRVRGLRFLITLGVTVVWGGCGAAQNGPLSPPVRREDAPGPLESAIPGAPPPRIVAPVLEEISPDRLGADVRTLVGFGTRHTLSETTSNERGIGAARRWIKGELERYAHASGRTGSDSMTVSFDAYTQAPDGKRIPREVEIVNVMAVLPGKMPEAVTRRYYVVGHYDSRATDVNDATSDAPGANDDGSGTALVLELARVLAPRRFDSTIVLVATAAEEQGLYGAKHRAHAAKDAGEDVRAVLSDDIVGDPSSSSGGAPFRQEVRVFSEGVPEGLAPDALAEVRRLAAESDAP